MNWIRLIWLFIFFCNATLIAQSTPEQINGILDQQIGQSEVVSYQFQKYLISHAPQLPRPGSAKEWTTQIGEIRERLLANVIFRGWPKAWVDSSPKFEDVGLLPSGKGYTRRKLRYEVVPGMWSAAILYQPENLQGPAPAILNVTGHVGAQGKSIEYEQKRCINYALQGIIALSLDWLGQGELGEEENQHGYAGHLDLVGANAEGLFYLEMRRGLDYLYALANVDRSRIGMTGLSGGGWQTMILGALDDRISVAVPVAGYDALGEWIPRMPGAAGDNEQGGTDMYRDQENATFTAMRAPRPTLLIFNAEDDCCFRAGIVKPYLYEAVKPFFELYRKGDNLQFHENTDPSTHNYQSDNRVSSYRFFSLHFNMPLKDREIPVDAQIKNYEELEVGLPKENLTILSLAKKLAAEIKRIPVPSDGKEKTEWVNNRRTELMHVVRYEPVTITNAWAINSTKSKGIESLSYRFEMSNNLPATGIWLKAIATSSNAPVVMVLNDKGKKFAADDVSRRVNRGEQVLALDLLFTGDDSTQELPPVWAYPEMLAAGGDRPLGMEVAQLFALTQWITHHSGTTRIRLEVRGMRMQIVALIASAIEPALFSEVVVHEGISSLNYLLSKPVRYEDAADLFCLDLYKTFDLDQIATLAGHISYESEAPMARK